MTPYETNLYEILRMIEERVTSSMVSGSGDPTMVNKLTIWIRKKDTDEVFKIEREVGN